MRSEEIGWSHGFLFFLPAERSSSAPYLLAFQILLHAFFRIADGSGVRDFCEVVSIKAGDVILIRAGDCFLCLDDLQIVRDPGRETVLRLRKRLLCQIHRASGDFHLLGSSREVEQRSPNLVIDTTAQIFQLRSCLLECGLSLQDIPMYFSPLKQWNGNRTRHGMRVADSRRGPVQTEVDREPCP